MSDRKNNLSEGVIGTLLVDWFQKEQGITPVDAECLAMYGLHEVDYRITFDDESVADYKVLFDPTIPFEDDLILSIEEFNRVI